MSIILNDQLIAGGGSGGASGASRNIGEIVASTTPLIDAGLHLLDGSLINGSGSYSDFVDYIADLVSTYPDCFTTESDWQTSVTSYGVCGKFVYNSTNNTVRLPKYNSKIYTGGGTAPVIGNDMTLGLTDGTNNYGLLGGVQGLSNWGLGNGQTSSYGTNVGDTGFICATPSQQTFGITTDGTKSGIITDLANITTSLDGYYYIVIATSTKTNIQVDIDNVMTDLNSKADTDLTNINDIAKIAIAHNAMPSSTYEDLTLGASGTTYTAPADGWFAFSKFSSGAGQYVMLQDDTNGEPSSNSHSAGSNAGLRIFLPVRKGQIISAIYTAGGSLIAFRFIYAVGSEGEA